jgi:hypothetical protein
MKKIILFIVICTLCSCSTLQEQPTSPSDIEQYCIKIYGERQGSKRAMMTCLQQERRARIELSEMTIPVEVAEYCGKLSASTGGSYSVMLTCVQKELER